MQYDNYINNVYGVLKPARPDLWSLPFSLGYNQRMRNFVLPALFLSLIGTAFAQGRQGTYYSLGGYGNVLYPGTGHGPPTPPGGINGPNFVNRGPGVGHGFGGPPPAQQH